MAIINGTSGNDTLTGTAAVDTLYGFGGNDWLIGSAGADVMNGGDGFDTADYGASTAAVTVVLSSGTGSGGYASGDTLISIESVIGSSYADTLTCDGTGNVMRGMDGNDVLKAGAGADTLDGGAGVDTASFAYSTTAVDVNLATGVARYGDAEGDTLISIENLSGSAYDDILTGDAGNNSISGGNGNDTLIGGLGADALIGGNGNDRVVYSDSDSGVTVNLATGTGSGGAAQGDTYSSIEIVEGSDFTDFLYGGSGSETLIGGNGNDYLIGSVGADVLHGGAGTDMVNYLYSNARVNINLAAGTASGGYATGDTLISIEKLGGSIYADVLIGDDQDNWFDGNAGADTINGGAGIDTVSYAGGDAGIYANLSTGLGVDSNNDADTLIAIENVNGSDYDDRITGDGGGNVLNGRGGNDTLNGGGGLDTLIGGTGNDFYYVNNDGVTVIELAGGGADRVSTLLNTFTLMDNVEELVFAGSGGFTGIGNDLNNVIQGGSDDDTLTGGGGDDTMTGGGGLDTAIYHGKAYFAVFTQVAGGWTIANPNGGDASDILTGIEQAQFDDRLIYLDGRNNAPLIAGPLGVSTNEDAAPISTDLLQGARDLEGQAMSVMNFAQNGGPAVTFSQNGANFQLDPGQFNALSSGETATLTFAYDVSDGSASVAQTLTVTVAGRNDAPTVAGSLSAATDEDAAPIAVNLLAGAADVDASDTLSVVNLLQNGGPAATFSQSGGNFQLNPGQFNALADGETATLTFAYDVSDGSASVAQTLTVTVAGRNDAPTVAGSLSAATDEDAAPIAVNLLAGAADVDASDTLSVVNLLQNGGPAVTFSQSGGNFQLDPGQLNALADGETATLTFAYDVSDGSASVAQTLTVTVAGRDEPLTLVGTAADDVLTGQNAADTLTGGDGTDTLTGGGGADVFHFNNPTEGTDVITDFQSGTDILEFSSANFDNLPTGMLDASRFALDTATDSNVRFVFDTASQTLMYDADGSGVGAAISIATLSVTTLNYNNIYVTM